MAAPAAQANAEKKPPNPHDTLRYAMLDYMNSLVMSSTKLSDEEKEGLVRTRISPCCPSSSPCAAIPWHSQLKSGERKRRKECQESADPKLVHASPYLRESDVGLAVQDDGGEEGEPSDRLSTCPTTLPRVFLPSF
jgi:hypothetical protein